MDMKTAEILSHLNTQFYAENASSFSETRVAPWPGWKRCLEVVEASGAVLNQESAAGKEGAVNLRVFDLACGNMRFEAFLQNQLPFQAYAVDNCQDLAVDMPQVIFQNLDVMTVLLDGGGARLAQLCYAPRADMSVCFGFMHHVPTQCLRQEVLNFLINQTAPGGFVCVSFWAFLNNVQLAAKAWETHNQGMLDLGISDFDEGDFLLGWKNKPGVYRYCHHFSSEEVDQLLAAVADRAAVVDRFFADGRTGDMNAYVILRVR